MVRPQMSQTSGRDLLQEWRDRPLKLLFLDLKSTAYKKFGPVTDRGLTPESFIRICAGDFSQVIDSTILRSFAVSPPQIVNRFQSAHHRCVSIRQACECMVTRLWLVKHEAGSRL